jgi:hypothetical protein
MSISIVVNLAGSIVTNNDGDVWVKYGWTAIASPFDPVATTPDLSTLGYWVLDLTKLGDQDAPFINVGQADLPIWLADADKKIIGTPQFVTSTKKKIPITMETGILRCGSASLATTNKTAFLIVPMAYVTAATKPNKNAYLEMLGNDRSKPPRNGIDWSAAGWALFWTFIIMLVLGVVFAIVSGVLGIGYDFAKTALTL